MYTTRLVALYLAALCSSVAFGDLTCSAIKCGEVGGACDASTLCPAPTVCQDGVCRYNKEGDNCTAILGCTGTETYCKDGKCVNYRGDGENCTEYKCQSDLKCGDDKICHNIPSKEGATCTESIGCDTLSGLYCKDGKCFGLPGEGQACYKSLCKAGLRCDNDKCVKLPKKGESCSIATGCEGSDLYCAVDIVSGSVCREKPAKDEKCTTICKEGYTCVTVDSEKVCKKSNPGKGEYCKAPLITCSGRYQCENNKCVDTTTCSRYDGCTGYPSRICLNGNCVESMKVEDGYACEYVTTTAFDSATVSSFQCKEGSGCVKNLVTGKATCVKIETKLKDRKNCTLGACPADSFCSCDDNIGNIQCIPYAYSDKGIRDDVRSYYDLKDECGDLKIGACADLANKLSAVTRKINDKFYSYSYLSRCDLFAAASTLKVSATLLLALLLFFSL